MSCRSQWYKVSTHASELTNHGFDPGRKQWNFRDETIGKCCFLQMGTGDSPGELSEKLVTQEKRKKGWRMNCDVGEATEELENEL